MQRIEYLTEQLRVQGESIACARVTSLAVQGLPKLCYSMARSFSICNPFHLTQERIKHAIVQEEQRRQTATRHYSKCEHIKVVVNYRESATITENQGILQQTVSF